MTTQDDFRWAEAAVRETVRRSTLSLAARLEREGRRFMSVPATKAEGLEQLELAKSLRAELRKAGRG